MRGRGLICICVIAVGARTHAQRLDARSATPREPIISLRAAAAKVVAISRRLGLGKLDLSKWRAEVRERPMLAFMWRPGMATRITEWALSNPSYEFMLFARSGELTEFRDQAWAGAMKRNLAKPPGAFARTRKAFDAHVAGWASRLGLPRQLQVDSSDRYDRAGRLIGPTSAARGSFEGIRREYSFAFDPASGRPVYVGVADLGATWPVNPRAVVEPGPLDISGAEAVRLAGKFAQALGLPKLVTSRTVAVLSSQPPARQKSWLVSFPLYSINVDSVSGSIIAYHTKMHGVPFSPGDQPFFKSKAQAWAHLRNLGRRIGIPPTAVLSTRRIREPYLTGQWIERLEGDFSWAQQHTSLVCDMSNGTPISMAALGYSYDFRRH
jgi:hypothetical protein